ncbi:MAG TPA: DUF58 domain-containing protein [Thermoanaerobaculia bacterium]|nr:DUF58 domain-containing protein [Thermoanaerobaculia bacterium]
MRPTARAIALAALGLPPALLPALGAVRLWIVWPVFLGLLTLALAADARLSPRRGQLAATVELPGAIAIGERGLARLTLRAPWRLPVIVAVDLSDRLVAQPRLHGEASLEGGVLTCPLLAKRRGRVAVERLWVRYTGPLGLIARVVVIEVGREVLVVPDTRPVRAAALRFEAERNAGAGQKIERYTGDGSEFDSLREHVHGDDSRAIDWKASAHHKRLVARQNRAERNHQVVLAVDTGRLMAEPLAGVPRLDHAATAALLLGYVSLRTGDRAGLAGFDSRLGLWLAPRSGLGAFQALQRGAGRLEYSSVETNFTLALTTLGARLTRRSLVVVLTELVDTVTAELMVENLSRLARRHAVIFVAMQDPGLAALAAAAPRDLRAMNRAVVAAGLLRDREVVLRELAQRGIHALDASPQRVQARLINTYLEIKRRELI